MGIFDQIDKGLDKAAGVLDKAAAAKAKFESVFKKPSKVKMAPEPNLFHPAPVGAPAILGAGSVPAAGGGFMLWIALAVALFLIFLALRKG